MNITNINVKIISVSRIQEKGI